ncbi:MAG TPA: SHOCT domain-containing protein [Phycisphaerae bacterium]|nr:SHOCT domain-containing protein [Phycisphaerae bacterium]
MGSNIPDIKNLVLICVTFIGLAIIGFVAAFVVRKRLVNPQQNQLNMGFSLDQLDELYQKGELSEREYKQIKARAAQKAAERVLKSNGQSADKNLNKKSG